MADLYERYYNQMVVALSRIAPHSGREDREDAAQQAFYEVVRDGCSSSNGSATTLSHLTRRACCRLADRYRADQARRRREQDHLPHDPSDEAWDPLALLWTQERQEQVRCAVAGLPENQRRAVELTEFEDRKLADAAKKMGCSISEAKRRRLCGKQSLISILREIDV